VLFERFHNGYKWRHYLHMEYQDWSTTLQRDGTGHRIRGLNKLKDYIKNLKEEVVNYNT